MVTIRVREKRFQYYPDENIYFSRLLTTRHSSVSINSILPGQSQSLHRHRRPGNGDEYTFIFSGVAEITIGSKRQTCDTNKHGPVLIALKSGTKSAIKNVGSGDLEFLSIFAPPLKRGEIAYATTHGKR